MRASDDEKLLKDHLVFDFLDLYQRGVGSPATPHPNIMVYDHTLKVDVFTFSIVFGSSWGEIQYFIPIIIRLTSSVNVALVLTLWCSTSKPLRQSTNGNRLTDYLAGRSFWRSWLLYPSSSAPVLSKTRLLNKAYWPSAHLFNRGVPADCCSKFQFCSRFTKIKQSSLIHSTKQSSGYTVSLSKFGTYLYEGWMLAGARPSQR